MERYTQPFLPRYMDDYMLCPKCGDQYTHVDTVMVVAGPEDHVDQQLSIDATTGRIETRYRPMVPTGQVIGAGRRHRIVLIGTCENGGCTFSIVFTQHKGVTFAEIV